MHFSATEFTIKLLPCTHIPGFIVWHLSRVAPQYSGLYFWLLIESSLVWTWKIAQRETNLCRITLGRVPDKKICWSKHPNCCGNILWKSSFTVRQLYMHEKHIKPSLLQNHFLTYFLLLFNHNLNFMTRTVSNCNYIIKCHLLFLHSFIHTL